MYTLVYYNNHFNRPDTLECFIQSNVQHFPLLRIDCLTPYKGSEKDFIHNICEYLGRICPDYEVKYNETQNASIEDKEGALFVHFIVIQLQIRFK